MMGESVVNTSRSGTRLILTRLRRAMTWASETALVRLIGWLLRSGASASRRGQAHPRWRGGGPRLIGVGAVPGQRQEHIVKGRSPQSHVGDCDLLGVEAPQRVDEYRGAAGDRHQHRARMFLDDLLAHREGS